MRCVPAGLESLLGRARLLCHRWSTLVSVGAPAAHRRAPTPSKLLTALDARLVHEWTCRRGAMLHDQHDRCAACQLAWRRCWAVPGCSAIGGAPQQVCRLQLRIDVHHLSELLTALDACAVREKMPLQREAR